ncbi:MAG: hypothetical protein ACHQK9_01980 [Reyranellales bacterium]
MELDKDRLVKLLNMTQSQHDGEALSAIRKSNELLRLYKASWSDALGLSKPESAEPIKPEPPKSAGRPEQTTRASNAAREPELPEGYQRARHYRNAFRQEPFVPRLLGFPFWIIVELLGLIFPRMYLNTSGRIITVVFTISMILGILAWVGVGYYLVFEV